MMRSVSPKSGIGMTSQRTRDRLVSRLREKGIKNNDVLAAIAKLPRHLFVDEALNSRAYEDTALPIGLGQTISQPFVVALMSEALLRSGRPSKVLEIGTGSGYQAAVLSLLVDQVFSVERIDELSRQARRRFRELGIRNIRAKCTDGYDGWPANAPYDAIMVTAAAPSLPLELVEQLEVGGKLVAPLGQGGEQRLIMVTKTAKGIEKEDLGGVSFVPMLPGQV